MLALVELAYCILAEVYEHLDGLSGVNLYHLAIEVSGEFDELGVVLREYLVEIDEFLLGKAFFCFGVEAKFLQVFVNTQVGRVVLNHVLNDWEVLQHDLHNAIVDLCELLIQELQFRQVGRVLGAGCFGPRDTTGQSN